MDISIKNPDLIANPVFQKARAWLVHLYTSLGLIVAMLSFIAILNQDARGFFIFQFAAMFIDSTDGAMARSFKVKFWTPEMDGRKLDDITDYINYTFLPVLFAYRFGVVAESGLAVLAVVLVTSVYGFCRDAAKTCDGYFTGFPNFWNVLIFYLFVFNAGPNTAAIILLVFSGLIFIPLKFLSYSSKSFRALMLAFSFLFAVPILIFIIQYERQDIRLIYLSLAGPVFYMVAAILTHLKKSPA